MLLGHPAQIDLAWLNSWNYLMTVAPIVSLVSKSDLSLGLPANRFTVVVSLHDFEHLITGAIVVN